MAVLYFGRNCDGSDGHPRRRGLTSVALTWSSDFPFIQTVDEAADHLGNYFKLFAQSGVPGFVDKATPPSHLQQRYTFLGRSARNYEEVAAVGLGETPVAFGQIRGDGQGGPIQLIYEEVVTARKPLSECRDTVCQIDGLLVDLQVLEHEGHGATSRKNNLNSRTGEQETAGEPSGPNKKSWVKLRLLRLFNCSTAHLLYFEGPHERPFKIGATGVPLNRR
jgi:hypothetical protein